MLKHIILGVLFCALCINVDIYAQKSAPKPTVAAKVEGLELPEMVLASANDQFVTIEAKTKGNVKWLVICDKKINYMEDSDKKSIILGTIPEDTAVYIVAIADVNGKMTDFVSTKVVQKKNEIKKQESEPEKLDYKIRWH
jgi:hypothetical protein